MKVLHGTDYDCVEMVVVLVHKTEKALLVSNGEVESWVPIDLLECDFEPVGGDEIKIVIPEWLAIQKELV